MLLTLRTVVLSVTSTLFFFALALYFVLGTSDTAFDLPPLWLLAAQVVAALAIHLLLSAVGYRTPALAPGTPPQQAATRSVAAFSSTTILRMVLAESVAIVSVAAAFVVTQGEYVAYLTGGVLALVLLAVHAFPTERTVARVQASLERDGATSHLREKLGLPERPTGPVQRL